MMLYHSTTRERAEKILQQGFAISNVGDSPGRSWFASTEDGATRGRPWADCLVIVELPAEVAEQHRSYLADGDSYLDNYCVPWSVVNDHRPFELRPITGARG
jgi:hypothetical protein